jgi:hypothetical protein
MLIGSKVRTGLTRPVKICNIYNVSSKLVNIRLDAERLRKTVVLRARGLRLSDVVRDAIDERFAALGNGRAPRDVHAMVTQILEDYPEPSDLPRRSYDVHERKAARRAIQRTLRSKAR